MCDSARIPSFPASCGGVVGDRGRSDFVIFGRAGFMGGASIGAGGVISPPLFLHRGGQGVHKLITTIQ